MNKRTLGDSHYILFLGSFSSVEKNDIKCKYSFFKQLTSSAQTDDNNYALTNFAK